MSEVYSVLSNWCKAESEIDDMATDMATDLGGRYCGALETKSVSASVSSAAPSSKLWEKADVTSYINKRYIV